MNAVSGGEIGVQQNAGGTALSLTGSNATLNNAGIIDANLQGPTSVLTSGTPIARDTR